ncbi:MAG: DNA-binding transcriptional regulator [Verrucomicrobiota bacterium]
MPRKVHSQTRNDIPQVAILVSTIHEWGRSILKGIITYANEVGPWHVWLQPRMDNTLNDLPPGWRGDGIIANVHFDSLAKDIIKSSLPVVNVCDTDLAGFSAPSVRTDDDVGTELAARHFIDKGLTSIAYVGPVDRSNPIKYAASFEAALRQQGMTCSRFDVKTNDKNLQEQLIPWLVGLTKPVGILACGHGYARAVVDACMEANISVPHDVAVLSGSYDELLSNACFPALSGVLAPTEKIGYTAAQKLHRLMLGEDVPHDITYIQPRGIIERMSTDTLAVRDPKLLQVVKFIRENAFEPISMTDILRAVPMSRRSLERRFQQSFGRTPIEEIRRIRIDKARKLLAETDMPMQLIAEKCGYATYNYLTHVFKRTTGMTPRDYRRQFKL